MTALPSRRSMLAGAGAIVVHFSLVSRPIAQQGGVQGGSPQRQPPNLPGSLSIEPRLDAWVKIDARGQVTIFTGKAELGQGLKTAIVQVAAEELGLEPKAISLVTADTDLTANEGYTAGSQSMQNSATAVRHATAQVRMLLQEEAARRLGSTSDRITVSGGLMTAPDGRSLSFAELASGIDMHVPADGKAPLKEPATFTQMGKSLPRLDIPAKVTGGAAYVQDMRLEGMLHARVVRPERPGAMLESVNVGPVDRMPGVVRVVRDGSFLAVVAEREWSAVKAMRTLSRLARWSDTPPLPEPKNLDRELEQRVSETRQVAEVGTGDWPTGRRLEAIYTRPYNIHGSIGPSCAVARFDGGKLTVWSHTQGVYPDRAAIAEMLGMSQESVRCIHVEGSGCYGHNGADDAAADAALVARAVPGRPVRIQWTREQEHGWEPYGPAMIGKVKAALGLDGRIVGWDYGVWSNTHTTRPGRAGALLASRYLAKSFAPEEVKIEITPAGNGDRNAVPIYDIPRKSIRWHFIKEMPLRVSALRALGAYLNVFATESFMDELALAAGADPVAFRLAHIADSRARAVIETASDRFGWTKPLGVGRGRGFAFARYKNLAAYCALAVEVDVERDTGRVRLVRAVAAIDSGEIINPDGIRNQTEGGILQAMSWTLYEQVTFDPQGIRSIDWSSYPILRFDAVPELVEVHVIPQPGTPFLGTGEAAQGPAGAAIANAIAHSTGKRMRNLPFTRDKILAVMRA